MLYCLMDCVKDIGYQNAKLIITNNAHALLIMHMYSSL